MCIFILILKVSLFCLFHIEKHKKSGKYEWRKNKNCLQGFYCAWVCTKDSHFEKKKSFYSFFLYLTFIDFTSFKCDIFMEEINFAEYSR